MRIVCTKYIWIPIFLEKDKMNVLTNWVSKKCQNKTSSTNNIVYNSSSMLIPFTQFKNVKTTFLSSSALSVSPADQSGWWLHNGWGGVEWLWSRLWRWDLLIKRQINNQIYSSCLGHLCWRRRTQNLFGSGHGWFTGPLWLYWLCLWAYGVVSKCDLLRIY